MADTDFYTFTKVQTYSPDILAGDQTTSDQFGLDATKWLENLLLGILGSIPTGASITDDMEAACNYKVVHYWKCHIKDYKAGEAWEAKANVQIESIRLNAIAANTIPSVVVPSSYQTNPMDEND